MAVGVTLAALVVMSLSVYALILVVLDATGDTDGKA